MAFGWKDDIECINDFHRFSRRTLEQVYPEDCWQLADVIIKDVYKRFKVRIDLRIAMLLLKGSLQFRKE